MNSLAWALVAAVVLLGLNAFFVASEFALVGARRSQIEPVAQQGSKRARRTLSAMEQVSLMMAGAQLGITICSIGLGALAEPAIAAALGGPFEAIGIPQGWLHPVSFVVALIIVTALHVVLGEMVPKNLTLAAPDRAAMALGPALSRLVRLIRPLIVLLNGATNLALRVVGIRVPGEVASSYDIHEVAQLAQESHRAGMIDDTEYGLMAAAVSFTRATVADVLVPWAEVTTVSAAISGYEAEALSGRTRHLRFPVLDDAGLPIGYLHVKDLLVLPGSAKDAPIAPTLIRTLPTLAADSLLPRALSVLQADKAVMAVALTSDGEPVGIVTVAGLVEALVDPGQAMRTLNGNH
ncbi:MAG: hemolysin family protein [Actinomycetes bacterium]